MKLKKITFSILTLGLTLNTPVWAADFAIGSVRIEGEQHTSETTVRSLMPVKEGDHFTDAVGENIIRSLHASGFYENVLLEQNGDMLIVTVQERPIISDLTITGAKVLTNDAILKQMSAMRGTIGHNDNDLIGGKRAEISYDEKLRQFDATTEQRATEALASTGLAKGDFFNQEILVRALRALDGAYKEQGKHNVVITPEVQQLSRNRVAITIKVEEGETTKVRKIDFEGNQVFSDSRLRRQINLTDGGLFAWLTKSDVFSWEKFGQDKARLETFYREHGYYDFRVDYDDVQRQFNENKDREEVTIKVYEGEKYHWGKMNISGDHKEVPLSDLQKLMSKLKTGKLSDYDALQNVLMQMRFKLQSAGYAHAQVSAETTRRVDDKGRHILDVTALLAPGNRVAVRTIAISGNTKTRDEVIRRELRQMEAAQYDQSKIDRSIGRLRQLGYFEDVEIQAATVPEDEQQMDLAVKVKERNTGSLNASVGWSQDDGLVLAGSVAQDNLFGTGKSTALSISRSKVRQNANLSFTDPYFTPDGVSMTYSLHGSKYAPYKLSSNSRNYGMNRYGFSTIMGIPFTEYDRVNFGLGVEHIGVKLLSNPPYRYQRFVDENGSRNWIYKGMVSWYRNTTDDAYWPTQGYQANVTGEVALPGSGIQYYQFGHQQTWYFPLSRNFTLMLNGQLGYSGKYGKTKEVPFMFNQTGGGLGSVRGFESGSLGPKVYDVDVDGSRSTESYGGAYAVNVNAELLFPFPGIKDSRSVRLSLFADAGSVWDGKTYTPSNYSRSNPHGSSGYYRSNHKSTFSNELRYSAGAALTWISPMGPIKLSYAYPLKKKDTDLIQRFQFQLGTIF
ncbi:MAG: outer membrane protein assembly factor BamA [Alysiella sp.]|uniref:outer membrane protein assembly factor BamA n=1 Tax=Alysiella sp. TaxID=1872483 RepID=UPI0026DC39F9|nr:outer membrane protein assembly factor BamA [Alysiella sp.]MDO4433141.1 outer membrane protein assembly factor BamA [Alysiella sp.]